MKVKKELNKIKMTIDNNPFEELDVLLDNNRLNNTEEDTDDTEDTEDTEDTDTRHDDEETKDTLYAVVYNNYNLKIYSEILCGVYSSRILASELKTLLMSNFRGCFEVKEYKFSEDISDKTYCYMYQQYLDIKHCQIIEHNQLYDILGFEITHEYKGIGYENKTFVKSECIINQNPDMKYLKDVIEEIQKYYNI